jgi:hypothetical protein
VLALSLVGCGSASLSPQEKAQRCQDFAAALAVAGLRSTPSEAVARDVANSLDNKLSRLGAPALHTPATEIHRDLHAVEVARREGDAAKADAAAARARQAVAELARACGLPEADFLGG